MVGYAIVQAPTAFFAILAFIRKQFRGVRIDPDENEKKIGKRFRKAVNEAKQANNIIKGDFGSVLNDH